MEKHWDLWYLPTFVLWMLFLGLGLFPEEAFYWVRSVGEVVAQSAAVNSPIVLTLALSLYMSLFAYRNCRSVGLSQAAAQSRALQIWLIALVAFLPFPLVLILSLKEIPVPGQRNLVMFIGTAKIMSWAYLLLLLFLYYVMGYVRAFASVLSIVPRSRYEQRDHEDTVLSDHVGRADIKDDRKQ